MLAQKIKDVWTQWNGEEINGTQNPPNIEQVWTDEELHAIGLYKVVDQAVPDGKMADSWSLQDVAGVPTNVPVLKDIPPPIKSIDDRLHAIEIRLGM